MFRKIVTELAYSPALAGSLGTHIKSLRDERSKRQVGLIFVTLAVVVQLLSTLFPPESANANNPAVFIDGGIQSIDDYLSYYDQNAQNNRDLLNSLGISRSDIENLKLSDTTSISQPVYWSTANNRDSESLAYSFQTPSGKLAVAYYQPTQPGSLPIEAYVGSTSRSQSRFAITKQGGNLITEATDQIGCQAWYSTSVTSQPTATWGNTTACPESLQASISARTITPGTPPGNPDSVNNSDRIRYTITLENNGSADVPALPAINLEDALEYSRILDNGGSDYNYDTRMMSWPTTTLSPGQSLQRSFTMQILPTTPSTARGEFVNKSYDCQLQLTFGNSLSTIVNCPFVKQVETLTKHLPKTGMALNIGFAASILAVTLFLYARSRQLLTELYIIRHNHIGGL